MQYFIKGSNKIQPCYAIVAFSNDKIIWEKADIVRGDLKLKGAFGAQLQALHEAVEHSRIFNKDVEIFIEDESIIKLLDAYESNDKIIGAFQRWMWKLENVTLIHDPDEETGREICNLLLGKSIDIDYLVRRNYIIKDGVVVTKLGEDIMIVDDIPNYEPNVTIKNETAALKAITQNKGVNLCKYITVDHNIRDVSRGECIADMIGVPFVLASPAVAKSLGLMSLGAHIATDFTTGRKIHDLFGSGTSMTSYYKLLFTPSVKNKELGDPVFTMKTKVQELTDMENIVDGCTTIDRNYLLSRGLNVNVLYQFRAYVIKNGKIAIAKGLFRAGDKTVIDTSQLKVGKLQVGDNLKIVVVRYNHDTLSSLGYQYWITRKSANYAAEYFTREIKPALMHTSQDQWLDYTALATKPTGEATMLSTKLIKIHPMFRHHKYVYDQTVNSIQKTMNYFMSNGGIHTPMYVLVPNPDLKKGEIILPYELEFLVGITDVIVGRYPIIKASALKPLKVVGVSNIRAIQMNMATALTMDADFDGDGALVVIPPLKGVLLGGENPGVIMLPYGGLNEENEFKPERYNIEDERIAKKTIRNVCFEDVTKVTLEKQRSPIGKLIIAFTRGILQKDINKRLGYPDMTNERMVKILATLAHLEVQGFKKSFFINKTMFSIKNTLIKLKGEAFDKCKPLFSVYKDTMDHNKTRSTEFFVRLWNEKLNNYKPTDGFTILPKTVFQAAGDVVDSIPRVIKDKEFALVFGDGIAPSQEIRDELMDISSNIIRIMRDDELSNGERTELFSEYRSVLNGIEITPPEAIWIWNNYHHGNFKVIRSIAVRYVVATLTSADIVDDNIENRIVVNVSEVIRAGEIAIKRGQIYDLKTNRHLGYVYRDHMPHITGVKTAKVIASGHRRNHNTTIMIVEPIKETH